MGLSAPGFKGAEALSYDAGDKNPAYPRQTEALYQPEIAPDQRGYAWTRPDAIFYFPDVPRYAPLQLKLELNFERPPGIPVPVIEVGENQNGNFKLLTTLTPQAAEAHTPAESKWHTFTLTIPPDLELNKGLEVQLKINGFKVAGDNRELGVVLGRYSVGMTIGAYLKGLVWPQPFLPAFLLLIVGILLWAARTTLDWLPVSIMIAAVSTIPGLYLGAFLPHSWWLCLLAIVVILSSQWWRFNSLVPAMNRAGVVPALIVTSIAFTAFFFSNPDGNPDIYVSLNWLRDSQSFGLWNFYHYSPQFQYPPLIVYVFWLYGQLLKLLGFNPDVMALRFLFSLCVPLCLGLALWLQGRLALERRSEADSFKLAERKGQMPELSTPVWLVFNTGMVFNAAVWGQTEPFLLAFLLGAFAFIYAGKLLPAGVILGLSFIFKPQAWFFIPVLGLVIIQRYGWRRAIGPALLGLVVAVSLALPVFGFNPASLELFFNQSRLAGSLEEGVYNAFNLFYLLGYSDAAPPGWLVALSFSGLALVYLLITWTSFNRAPLFNNKEYPARKKAALEINSTNRETGVAVLTSEELTGSSKRGFDYSDYCFALGLLGVAFFLIFVKIHERYLEYSLVWLVLAAQKYRRLYLPLAGLSLVSLLNMEIAFKATARRLVPDTFENWAGLLQLHVLQPFLALLTLGIFGYLLWLYLQLYLISRDVRYKPTLPVVRNRV
ncbi:MAG TPA: glycosyltransferase 87 family protein [Chloroflexia bacterium]|nr:glycosyltransferase 87 family protein [Chloroflexia bacterium]